MIVADDQEGVRFLLKTVIAGMGHEVFTAGNGAEAVNLAGSIGPDLVLMDIRMPVMNGFDALKAIRAGNSNIKVILMTAYSTEDITKQALLLGALTCLSKPFDVDYIKELIEDFSNGFPVKKSC